MERIEFNLLKAQINAQIEEIKKIFNDIEDRKKQAKESKAILESLGYKLHNLYCAFEDLFKIVAQFFENQIDDLARYHKELLRRLSLAIEGVRPALISKESYKELAELRAFRHFFRHAYFYELKYEKIISPLQSADKLKSLYEKDISQFFTTIEDELA